MSYYTVNTYQVPVANTYQVPVATTMQNTVSHAPVQAGTHPHMPSNQTVAHYLDKGEYTLQHMQATGRAQQLGPNGPQIVEDARKVLDDEKRMILHKNEGDALQNIVRHAKALGRDLVKEDSSVLRSLFSDWKGIVTNIMDGGETSEIMHSGSELLMGLKNTEEFLDLLSELINYAKLLVFHTESKVIGEKGKSETSHKEREVEREVIKEKLRATLNTLAANDLWSYMVQQGNQLASRAAQVGSDAAHTPGPHGLWRLLEAPEIQSLTQDMKVFLQKLVGEEFDVTPLFDYTKAALRDISHDPELHKLIHEAEGTLTHIASEDDGSHFYESTQEHTPHTLVHNTNNLPQLTQQENNQLSLQKHHQAQADELRALADHLEAALHNIKNNTNLQRAKEEAHIMREVFMNDPENRQLVADAKQLWRDLHSASGGLDPSLLHGLREMVVPVILEHLKDIPVPPINDSVSMLGKMEYSIDGVRVSIPEILPNNLHVKVEYELDTNITKLNAANRHTYLYFEANNIHLHLRNVAWAYQRLSHPRRSDSGHIDLDTLGSGVGLKMRVQLHNDHTVEVRDVSIRIDRFQCRVSDSRHNRLYQGLAHLFARQIKKNVERSLEVKMRDIGAKVGGKVLNTVMEMKSKSHDVYSASMAKKSLLLEQLHHKRAQRKTDNTHKTKQRIQQIRSNGVVQDIIHSAANNLTDALDAQQQKIETRKERVHDENVFKAAEEGLARPTTPPVPAIMFIPASTTVDSTPITNNLHHVTPGSMPDTSSITNNLHHVPDPQEARTQQILHKELPQDNVHTLESKLAGAAL